MGVERSLHIAKSSKLYFPTYLGICSEFPSQSPSAAIKTEAHSDEDTYEALWIS